MVGLKDFDVVCVRLSGVRNVLLFYGFIDINVVYGDYSYDLVRECLSVYVEKNVFFIVIICVNDIMVIGVIDEIWENLNLWVFEDILVVGFDGISVFLWYSY